MRQASDGVKWARISQNFEAVNAIAINVTMFADSNDR